MKTHGRMTEIKCKKKNHMFILIYGTLKIIWHLFFLFFFFYWIYLFWWIYSIIQYTQIYSGALVLEYPQHFTFFISVWHTALQDGINLSLLPLLHNFNKWSHKVNTQFVWCTSKLLHFTLSWCMGIENDDNFFIFLVELLLLLYLSSCPLSLWTCHIA